MSLDVYAATLLAVCLAFFLHFTWRWRLFPGPEALVLFLGTGTFAATWIAARDSGKHDDPYVAFLGVGVAAFAVGASVAARIFDFDLREELSSLRRRPLEDDLEGPVLLVLVLVGVTSLALVTVWFAVAGAFVPALAFQELMQTGASEAAAVYTEERARLAVTGRYLAPGFVAQVKDCLLPLVAILLLLEIRAKRSWFFKVLVAVLVTGAVTGLLATGARFPLAFFLTALLVIGSSPLLGSRRLSWRRIAGLSFGGLIILSALTVLMGRGTDNEDGALLRGPRLVAERIVGIPARERYQIMELFVSREPAWWGKATAEGLEVLLPGRKDVTLGNQFHQMVHGSLRGNVGLDYWGLAWFDFRWWGLGLFVMAGACLQAFTIRLVRGPRQLSRVVLLTYAGLLLGLAPNLQMLLLRGFAACLALYALLRTVSWLAPPRRTTPVSCEEPGVAR